MKAIKILLVFICMLMTYTSFSQSQKAKDYYEKGKKSYDDNNYIDAIQNLKEAIDLEENYADAWYTLGGAYYYSNKYNEALEAYAKLEKIDANHWAWYLYLKGESYRYLNRYDEAIVTYQQFMERFPKTSDRTIYHHQAKFRIDYIKGQQELIKQGNTMPDPVNLGISVNSISDEYSPQIDPTGKRLYFTSQRQGKFSAKTPKEKNNYGEDVYFVERQGTTWGSPVLLPEPINSYNNDFGSTFSGDGQTMVYVRCGDKDGVGNCDLFITQLNGENWSDPVNIGGVVNSKKWDSQPCISADGTKIIFASDREGGYGNADLYLIEKNRFGDWGVPQNLGTLINTPWTEKSPYLAPDGKTLYFCSNGLPGFGGADLFKSTLENNKWSMPVNLGKPINSEGDDNYFTISASGEQAYFASTREGGQGMYDLYQIEIPESLRPQPSVIVSGIVTDAKNQEKISAWVLVEDLNTGELIATNKSNSKTGEYLIVLPAGRNYSVSANKEGYFFYSQSFDVAKDAKYQELKKDIVLKPIEKGTKVVMNNIFFETGKAELKSESYLELAKAVELMKTNKSMTIEVGGHTDNVGSDETNMKLSHERAKSVMDFMVKAGIDLTRIQAKGYGETQPVASNDTEEGRRTNRRTEFIILSF